MSKLQRRKRLPLEQLRLDRDWSYARLGREIEKVTGVIRTDSGWFRICTERVTPTERTQNAIDQFMSAQSQEASR